jgi:hypothetical protein
MFYVLGVAKVDVDILDGSSLADSMQNGSSCEDFEIPLNEQLIVKCYNH